MEDPKSFIFDKYEERISNKLKLLRKDTIKNEIHIVSRQQKTVENQITMLERNCAFDLITADYKFDLLFW